MESLPIEILYNILLFVPPTSILTFLSVSRLFKDIDHESFWKRKFQHDYGDYKSGSWRQTYIDVLTGKVRSFKIYCEQEFIETIWVTEEQLLTRLKEILTEIKLDRVMGSIIFWGGCNKKKPYVELVPVSYYPTGDLMAMSSSNLYLSEITLKSYELNSDAYKVTSYIEFSPLTKCKYGSCYKLGDVWFCRKHKGSGCIGVTGCVGPTGLVGSTGCIGSICK